jgi:hypothetical protein
MRAQIQIALRIGAALLLLTALGLVADPMSAHKLISVHAYNSTTHFILAANLLGMSIVMLVMGENPESDFTGAVATALLILGVVIGHQMLVSHSMPHGFYTVIALIALIGLAVFLLVARTQEMAGKTAPARRPAATPAPARKPAAKKAGKKAGKKKAAKKKVTKKKATKKRR